MKVFGAAVLAFILIVCGVFFFTSIETIPTGTVGIVYNMNGGVEDVPLQQGWHFVGPTKSVSIYSIGLEQSYLTASREGDSPNDESFNIPTSDGKTVRVDLEFSYRFDPERISEIFTRFKGRSGDEVKNTFIKPKVQAWTQEVSARYPVTDIFGDKRTEINTELDTYLKEKFAVYGIIIDTVNFTDIRVDAETAAAIQRKVNAQQELELATIEAEQAQVVAKSSSDVAKIDAEKRAIEAQAEAEVIRIEAEAKAEANRVIAESLTPSFIDYIRTQKWDGALPMIEGGNTVPLIDIPLEEMN